MLKKVMLGLTLLVCCSSAYSAEVYYKWKDERGRIHYSATPPLRGEYERFTKHGTPVKNLQAEKETSPKPSQEKPSEQAPAPNEEAQAETATPPEAQKSLQQNCEKAKANLTLLQGDQDVIRIDPEGNKVVLSEQEREEALRQTRKDIEYFCEP